MIGVKHISPRTFLGFWSQMKIPQFPLVWISFLIYSFFFCVCKPLGNYTFEIAPVPAVGPSETIRNGRWHLPGNQAIEDLFRALAFLVINN